MIRLRLLIALAPSLLSWPRLSRVKAHSFIEPPNFRTELVYTDNHVYTIGDNITLRWETPNQAYSVTLWQQNLTERSANRGQAVFCECQRSRLPLISPILTSVGDQPKPSVPITPLPLLGQLIFNPSNLTTPTYTTLSLQLSRRRTVCIPLYPIISTSHWRTSHRHRVPLSPRQPLQHHHHRVLPTTPRRPHFRSLCLHTVRATTHFP
jgi:hypothetical protein